MAHEDPKLLLKHIKNLYKVFEFDPPSAKEYTIEEAEIMKDLHATFIKRGFTRLGRGMQSVDSG
jgi:coproporphyrinogen III oxidase-like Fe-S oxidoreductase